MSSSSRFRGIFSNQSNNRTDDKERSISQQISSMINGAFRSFKAPTYLIDTLYYSLGNFVDLEFIPYINSTNPIFSGVTVSRMTDSAYAVDSKTNIAFVGYRIAVPVDGSKGFATNQYNETITVQNVHGAFSAVATYDDAGTGFATEKDNQTYLILNGIGKYAYAKFMTIYFNNAVVPKTRRVEVFSYNA